VANTEDVNVTAGDGEQNSKQLPPPTKQQFAEVYTKFLRLVGLRIAIRVGFQRFDDLCQEPEPPAVCGTKSLRRFQPCELVLHVRGSPTLEDDGELHFTPLVGAGG
jgi:hypothetical protein